MGYYATANLLVLPSGRETWGLVINSAMCIELPIIATYQVGADLIGRDGENGFVYPSGDTNALVRCLQKVGDFTDEERLLMGEVQADDRQLRQSRFSQILGPVF